MNGKGNVDGDLHLNYSNSNNYNDLELCKEGCTQYTTRFMYVVFIVAYKIRNVPLSSGQTAFQVLLIKLQSYTRSIINY